jgi:hypothetical protein
MKSSTIPPIRYFYVSVIDGIGTSIQETEPDKATPRGRIRNVEIRTAFGVTIEEAIIRYIQLNYDIPYERIDLTTWGDT